MLRLFDCWIVLDFVGGCWDQHWHLDYSTGAVGGLTITHVSCLVSLIGGYVCIQYGMQLRSVLARVMPYLLYLSRERLLLLLFRL